MPGNPTHEAVGRVSARDRALDDRTYSANGSTGPSDLVAPTEELASVDPRRRHRGGGRSRLAPLGAHPWITGGVVAVVLAGAGVGIYFGTRGSGTTPAATTTVQTVSTGTIKQTVSATGSLAPAHEENLSFSSSGQVTSVSVKVGDTVKKGQTLATMESASLRSAVAQAQATVASSVAKVDGDDNASSTQLAADKAALTAARNQLTSAKAQLAAATMTSPIDGAVAEVNISTGDSVSGSSSSGGNSGSGSSSSNSNGLGQPTSSSSSSSSSAQILVISTHSWIVNASVDAASVGLIKTGNQAELTVSGSSNSVYGTISSIGLVSSSSSNTASYPVVIDVTGSPTGLHDGASVTASLVYKQLSNVVVISAAALHSDANGRYVDKQVNGKTVRTEVEVGTQSGAQVEITSGLAAGDKIVVPQLQRPNISSTSRNGSGNGGGNVPGGGNFPGGGFPGGGNGGLPGGGGFGG